MLLAYILGYDLLLNTDQKDELLTRSFQDAMIDDFERGDPSASGSNPDQPGGALQGSSSRRAQNRGEVLGLDYL